MKKYMEEIKEELNNNSIVLSFALCIIVIGVLSIFFKTSSTLLIGIAISSLLLTVIQCISEGNTLFFEAYASALPKMIQLTTISEI